MCSQFWGRGGEEEWVGEGEKYEGIRSKEQRKPSQQTGHSGNSS